MKKKTKKQQQQKRMNNISSIIQVKEKTNYQSFQISNANNQKNYYFHCCVIKLIPIVICDETLIERIRYLYALELTG